MLDLAFVRANLPLVQEKLGLRGVDPALLASFDALDASRRSAITEVETLKAQRNALSQQFGQLKREGKDVAALSLQTTSLKDRIAALESTATEADTKLRTLLEQLPNMPLDSVPAGASEHDNQLVKTWGEPTEIHNAKPHWELGEALGILDFERAAKISGSRFVVHFGSGARLERALANFMLDLHTRQHGYVEVLPPSLVNSRSLFGTGQLPKFAPDLFHCDDKGPFTGELADADHWLIPTAEVPVTNLFRDETIDLSGGTVSFCAYTPCFRSEQAGSYGKDVRGMIRQHQFQKVELVKFATPETSAAEHEALTAHAEAVLEALGLPYRRMLLCTGDMGFSAAKTFDLEVWLPGQQTYREISSCSNFESFQARRANIRFKPAGAAKSEFVHTLNGSGLAIGRTYLAILENYQQPDGSVRVPDVLVPYMGGETLIERQSWKGPAAMNLLRNYFWWTYERGSLHYDVMVTLILAFLFLAPHFINFGDRPVVNVPLSRSEVLVKNAGSPDHMVFEVRAADLRRASSDDERRAALLRIIQPIAGDVTLDSYAPVTDAHGSIVAWDATVTH